MSIYKRLNNGAKIILLQFINIFLVIACLMFFESIGITFYGFYLASVISISVITLICYLIGKYQLRVF
jgi:hypothetical protein